MNSKILQLEKDLHNILLLRDLKSVCRWILANPAMPIKNVVSQLETYQNRYGEDVFQESDS